MARDDFDHLRDAPAYSEVREWTGDEGYLLGVGEGTFSLYGTLSGAVHFDLEGRWTRASFASETYLRGLDGKVLHRFTAGGDTAHDEAARLEVHGRVHQFVRRALLAAGERVAPKLLARADGWTAARLEAERGRFLEVYRPVGIVPPDRYRSLIVQATEGCAWNGCLFCELYRGQRARVVPPDELRTRIRAVKAFVGSGVATRTGVFLGEANAMATAQPALLEILDIVGEELPDQARSTHRAGGISSFIDAFTESGKGPKEYAALAAKGLRRLFVGLESGAPETLAFLRKPSTNEGARRLVGAVKEGGVSVGAILLVGAAGLKGSATHVAQSAELIASLPLDAGDVVYLSPLVVEPGGRFDREAARAGLDVPGAEELVREEQELRAALVALGVRAQLARYDVRRFVYA